MVIKIRELKYYDVFLDNDNNKYITVNKMTRIKEDEGIRLPTVLFQAEALDELLIKYFSKDVESEITPGHGCSTVSSGLDNDGSSLPRRGEDSSPS